MPPLHARLSLLGLVACGLMVLTAPAAAELERTVPADGAKVYFISPSDGDVIEGAVTIRMGLSGMGVAPAGTDHPNTGHHHLLINTPLDDINLDSPLPFTDGTLHFGGGQTETTLDLPEGTHTLQLLFLDRQHINFDPPLTSEMITITVE